MSDFPIQPEQTREAIEERLRAEFQKRKPLTTLPPNGPDHSEEPQAGLIIRPDGSVVALACSRQRL